MDKDYYAILGISPKAEEEKIRHAYRILARRYHPDVNPDKGSEDKFKEISEAYRVLSNPSRRKDYDRTRSRQTRHAAGEKFKAYRQHEAMERGQRSKNYYQAQRRDYSAIKNMQHRPSSNNPKGNGAPIAPTPAPANFRAWLTGLLISTARRVRKQPEASKAEQRILAVSVIEVPLKVEEAIGGATKTIALPHGKESINVKLTLPAGVRTGSVVRLKARNLPGEEVIAVVRVLDHPFLAIDAAGIIIYVPITVNEAVTGATIEVPTLTEPSLVKLQPNTQSGDRIRLREKGIRSKNGRGDVTVEFRIVVPESVHAVGIKERVSELDPYYETPVRQKLLRSLGELG